MLKSLFQKVTEDLNICVVISGGLIYLILCISYMCPTKIDTKVTILAYTFFSINKKRKKINYFWAKFHLSVLLKSLSWVAKYIHICKLQKLVKMLFHMSVFTHVDFFKCFTTPAIHRQIC